MVGLFARARRAYVEERSVPEPNSGCWLWTLSAGSHGYGNARDPIERKNTTAHRLAFRAFRASIEDGFSVLHRCDNRMCVNPDHLWLGTHEENMADMVAKGRSRDRTPRRAKLRPRDVREIRASNASHGALARRYGVDIKTIWQAKNRLTHRELA